MLKYPVGRRRGCIHVLAYVSTVFIVAFSPKIALSASLSTPWQSADVGAPTIPGTVSLTSGVFTIAAGGTDIWGTADQFSFVYQPVVGDVDIIARVDSLIDSNPWAKAGVMIRSDLSAGAANALMLVSPERGTSFQRRVNANASTVNTLGPTAVAPAWVRLIRTGTSVAAYVSTTGASWTKVSSATIAIGATAYAGLAVTSHNLGVATTALLSHVSVSPLSLPSPQKDVDIGAPAIAGNASFAAGTYTVTGAGADIWGNADQFNFAYQPLSGDMDVVAHVASIANTSSWAKAGVMVRASLAADARHATTLLSAARGFAFQRRIDPGGPSVSTSAAATSASGWIRLKRTGYTFESYSSADGTAWTLIDTDTVPMTDPVYVGIAVTSHNTSAATKAVVDYFSITQTTISPNKPPTVTLTSPANGSTFTTPANISIAATASDPENRLARVDFFSGSTRIGSLSTSPFAMTLSNVAAGTYVISAQAFDADGGSAASAASTVTVTSASAVPTTAVFQASADDATRVDSYRLDVFANGANPAVATPVGSISLGKPAPDAAGTITVNEAAFFAALAPGSYIATVTAIGPGGSARSAPANFTR